MKCTLDPTLHNCPYLDKVTAECKNPNKCSMQEKVITYEPYRREPRWFEKYNK